MKHSFFGLAATLALVGGTQAAVLIDNFESYGPVFGDMNGQGNWLVTNGAPVIPAEGPVVIVDSYTWDASAQSATVGGVAPTSAALTTLYNNSFSVPLVSLTPTPTVFLIETAYTESTGGGNRNDFSFVLSSGINNLLTIQFTPGGAGQYDVGWTILGGGSGMVGTLNANTSTQFRLDTYAVGPNVGYTFSNAGSPVTSGTFSTVAPTDNINRFAVNWDSTSGGGVGNNSITIDNVSVVPEPSSALLGLLGAAFAFRRRRA